MPNEPDRATPLSAPHEVEPAGASSFASAVQAVTAEARRMGLVVPNFRSPPRPVGVVRTITRVPGAPIVSIAVRGRSLGSVRNDVVDGVLAANGLAEGDGEGGPVRARLLAATDASDRRLSRSAA